MADSSFIISHDMGPLDPSEYSQRSRVTSNSSRQTSASKSSKSNQSHSSPTNPSNRKNALGAYIRRAKQNPALEKIDSTDLDELDDLEEHSPTRRGENVSQVSILAGAAAININMSPQTSVANPSPSPVHAHIKGVEDEVQQLSWQSKERILQRDNTQNVLEDPVTGYNGNTAIRQIPAQTEEVQDIFHKMAQYDNALEVMLGRVKLNIASSKELVTFLKKRASIEEEYGKQICKLASSLHENLGKEIIKPGSYSGCWSSILDITDSSGKGRITVANSLRELADSLQQAQKHSERGRKELKECGAKYVKQINDSDSSYQKAKNKLAQYNADLEKLQIQKEKASHPSENLTRKSSFLNFFDGGNGGKRILKQEDDIRNKLELAVHNVKDHQRQLLFLKSEYKRTHLPNILKTLKEIDQECDSSLNSHLVKFVHMLDATLKSELCKLKPSAPDSNENCMMNHIAAVNDERDFKYFVEQNCFQNYANNNSNITSGGSTSLGNYNETGILSGSNSRSLKNLTVTIQPKPVFGVDLTLLAEREGRIVPVLIEKCTKAIEKHGLKSVGIYRLSGKLAHIQQLKQHFEKDDGMVVPLDDKEYLADINCITGILKLFLKQLPTALISNPGYEEFVKIALQEGGVASKEKLASYQRLISRLSKCQYYTLYYLIQHLRVVASHQHENKMNAVSLGMVFAPLLFRPHLVVTESHTLRSNSPGKEKGEEVPYADQVIEALIEYADDIFSDPDESD